MTARIGVLMGGPSEEREVSLSSGHAILAALRRQEYDAHAIELKDNIQAVSSDLLKVDAVFIALHGGVGENGTIQGYLDLLGVPYTGSGLLSSALCMNKHVSKELVRNAGVRTPDWTLLYAPDDLTQNKFDQFPLVVKPNDQGSTIGLTIVQTPEELGPALSLAFKHGNQVMVESFIEGRELTVAVLQGEILPVVEIVASHGLFDYDCKYTKGKSDYFCPAELTTEVLSKIQLQAKTAYKTLLCDHYARADFRLDKQGIPWFLEMNTLPGMTDTSLVPKAAKAVGMSFDELINRILQEALSK